MYGYPKAYPEEALQASEANNYARGIATSLGYLGRLAHQSGKPGQMIPYIEDALQVVTENGLDDLRAGLLILRGSAANHTESATAAEKYYLEVLIIARQRGAMPGERHSHKFR